MKQSIGLRFFIVAILLSIISIPSFGMQLSKQTLYYVSRFANIRGINAHSDAITKAIDQKLVVEPVFIGPQRNVAKCKIEILRHNIITVQKTYSRKLTSVELTVLKNSLIKLNNVYDPDSLNQDDPSSVVYVNSALMKILGDERIQECLKHNQHAYAKNIFFPESLGGKWTYKENQFFIKQLMLAKRPVIVLNKLDDQIEADKHKQQKAADMQEAVYVGTSIDEVLWLQDGGYIFSRLNNGATVAFPPTTNKPGSFFTLDPNDYRISPQEIANERAIKRDSIEKSHFPLIAEEQLHSIRDSLNQYIEYFQPNYWVDDKKIPFEKEL